jgi:hypothetical protein
MNQSSISFSPLQANHFELDIVFVHPPHALVLDRPWWRLLREEGQR